MTHTDWLCANISITVGNTCVEEISLSDDVPDPDSMEDAESAGSRGVKAPPSYAELSSLFDPLEQYAESCGIHEAGHFLRKAKMRFLAARAAKPARPSDIRSSTSSWPLSIGRSRRANNRRGKG